MNEEQKNSVTGEERAAVREGGSGERVMTNKMGTMPMNKLSFIHGASHDDFHAGTGPL